MVLVQSLLKNGWRNQTLLTKSNSGAGLTQSLRTWRKSDCLMVSVPSVTSGWCSARASLAEAYEKIGSVSSPFESL